MISECNKTVVIYDSLNYFIPHFEEKGIKVFRLYKTLPLYLRIIKKTLQVLKVNYSYWYEDWTKDLNEYENIILFATRDNYSLKYIKKKNPKIRIIFWYWNPALIMAPPQFVKRNLCEMWSFDPDDCKRFDMRFNTTFYFDSIHVESLNTKSIDVLFLGIDKGRRQYLLQLESLLLSINIKPLFHIVPNKGEETSETPKAIPYNEYLKLLSKSKSILDLKPIGQSGLTLRPMESLFFKKKLITNDSTILNQDFYHPENIFILGIDNINQLNDFLVSDYYDIDERIVQRYDVKNWLTRFF